MSGIWLEIDGEPVKAADCCWITYEPCGCPSGVSLVEVGGGDVLIDEDKALRFICVNKQLRDEFTREGSRLKLERRSVFSAMVDDKAFGKCAHLPQWGIEPTPIPEGMVWAASDGSGRRTNVKHLIRSDQLKDWSGASRPLCGRATKTAYFDGRWELDDCAKCVKCHETAMALSPALAVTA